MTLELADRSITHPKGVAKYVFVKVGSFHFPTNFVVIDFEADPRVPLILGRSFLRTSRALIDVYEGELILRDEYERLIFHVNKHSQKHANKLIKMINFIDVSCEDSVGEVLGLNHFLSGSTTSLSDSSPSFTSFETSKSLFKKFTNKLAPACLPPPGDDESFLKEDVQEENFQVYSNPLFEFDDNYNSSPRKAFFHSNNIKRLNISFDFCNQSAIT
ncbi:reverse transcriptase domain-containing protein [Tanacetum coccineum]